MESICNANMLYFIRFMLVVTLSVLRIRKPPVPRSRLRLPGVPIQLGVYPAKIRPTSNTLFSFLPAISTASFLSLNVLSACSSLNSYLVLFIANQTMSATNGTTHKVRVAVTQAEPVWLDLEKTVAKTCKLIKEAAENGAQLVTFPEVWIPGYPAWVW